MDLTNNCKKLNSCICIFGGIDTPKYADSLRGH
jgi:hypothetical protein